MVLSGLNCARVSGLNFARGGENIIFRREGFLFIDLVTDLVPIEFVLPVWSTSLTYVRTLDFPGGGVMLEGIKRPAARRFGDFAYAIQNLYTFFVFFTDF